MQLGDVVETFNAKRIRSIADWNDFIQSVGPGDVVDVVVRRAGTDVQLKMPL